MWRSQAGIRFYFPRAIHYAETPAMFIGHYAPALIAASVRRPPRLGAMFVAAQFVDIAFFAFVLAGVENMRAVPGFTVMNPMDLYHMPYTHSLIGALGFASAWAAGTRMLGGGWRAAWIGAAVVASHWLLDLIVHAPDLTIAGSGQRYGLALWNRPGIEMPLELGLVAVTLTLYVSRTRPRNARGRVAIVILTVALLTLQLVNWLMPEPIAMMDPVPVSTPLSALAAYAILSALAWWVAATRKPGDEPTVASL